MNHFKKDLLKTTKNVMLVRICLIILAINLITKSTSATDFTISDPLLFQENGVSYAIVTIKWENAWRNETNHDAAWVFFKIGEDGEDYRHLRVRFSEQNELSFSPEKEAEIIIPDDRMGFFVQPKSELRCSFEVTVKILVNELDLVEIEDIYSADLKAFGIEMVYIPEGSFTLGDTNSESLDFGGFFKSGSNSGQHELFMIEDESQVIQVRDQPGDLFYEVSNSYQGDQSGTIPSEFPKGVSAFYIMKYEPTQGQYVDFLNTLDNQQTYSRANFAGRDYYSNRGSIYIKDGVYNTKYPDAVCNFLSWDDAMAYADWAGLRPITEFEFTKASRGGGNPLAKEYPWGSDSKLEIQRKVNQFGQLYMFNGWDESYLSNNTKAVFGASYYWVMDLSGGLWERVVTIGHENGRNFKGTHGDGSLTDEGFATNEDWPSGKRAYGIGFRGGGFYEPGRGYNAYNPYSPIGYRTFGAYAGGQRSKAYGARFARSTN